MEPKRERLATMHQLQDTRPSFCSSYLKDGKSKPRAKKSTIEQQDILKEGSSQGIKMEEITKRNFILGETWKSGIST
eukprot:bmy_11199T0